jgi:hypothetical protein
MAIDQSQRPRFYEGQYLGAADLTAIEAEGRVHEARHILGAHTWGIAFGLDLREVPSPQCGGQVDVVVVPGYGWDGFGRTIAVLAPYKIPAEKFKSYVFDQGIDGGTPPGRLVKVWLRYREFATRPPLPGFAVCGPGKQTSRVQETFDLEVGELATSDQRDQVQIAGRSVVAEKALTTFDSQAPLLADSSVPDQGFPENGATARWLIPLGNVRWLPNQDATQPGQFVQTTDSDRAQSRALRSYIGAVAEAIQAPDGRLRLKSRANPPAAAASDDLVWVEGTLRVNSDVRLFDGKLDFRDAAGGDPNVPLKIQKVNNSQAGQDIQVIIGQNNPGHNRFAVGPLDASKNCDAKLVVQDDGNAGIGVTSPISKLEVAGDLALRQMTSGAARAMAPGETLIWNDGTWLRLNQNLDFTKPILGVHTPGVFAPMSLNVGGAGNWGDPGGGNVWVTGNIGVGTTSLTGRLALSGNSAAQGTLTLFSPNADFVYDGGSDGLFVFQNTGTTTAFLGGNVGMGTTTPTSTLHVEGDLFVSGAARRGDNSSSWTVVSDIRLKRNVTPLTDALTQLLQLQGVSFEWAESVRIGGPPGRQIGLVAHQVEKVFPEWISTGPQGYKEITIRGFEALTVEALRELKIERESMQARLRRCEKQIESLQKPKRHVKGGHEQTRAETGHGASDVPFFKEES